MSGVLLSLLAVGCRGKAPIGANARASGIASTDVPPAPVAAPKTEPPAPPQETPPSSPPVQTPAEEPSVSAIVAGLPGDDFQAALEPTSVSSVNLLGNVVFERYLAATKTWVNATSIDQAGTAGFLATLKEGAYRINWAGRGATVPAFINVTRGQAALHQTLPLVFGAASRATLRLAEAVIATPDGLVLLVSGALSQPALLRIGAALAHVDDAVVTAQLAAIAAAFTLENLSSVAALTAQGVTADEIALRLNPVTNVEAVRTALGSATYTPFTDATTPAVDQLVTAVVGASAPVVTGLAEAVAIASRAAPTPAPPAGTAPTDSVATSGPANGDATTGNSSTGNATSGDATSGDAPTQSGGNANDSSTTDDGNNTGGSTSSGPDGGNDGNGDLTTQSGGDAGTTDSGTDTSGGADTSSGTATGSSTGSGGGPAPPSNVVATPRNGAIRLQWDPVSGADSYQIFRKIGNGTEELVNGTALTYYLYAGLTNGQEYTYYVRTVSSAAESVDSFGAVVTPRASVPAAIDTIVSWSGDSVTHLRWDYAAGIDRYTVYRSTDPDHEGEALVTTALNTYDDTTATADRPYYYRVAAIDFELVGSPEGPADFAMQGIRTAFAKPAHLFELNAGSGYAYRLAGSWAFTEESGSTTKDVINSHHFTVQDGNTWVKGGPARTSVRVGGSVLEYGVVSNDDFRATWASGEFTVVLVFTPTEIPAISERRAILNDAQAVADQSFEIGLVSGNGTNAEFGITTYSGSSQTGAETHTNGSAIVVAGHTYVGVVARTAIQTTVSLRDVTSAAMAYGNVTGNSSGTYDCTNCSTVNIGGYLSGDPSKDYRGQVAGISIYDLWLNPRQQAVLLGQPFINYTQASVMQSFAGNSAGGSITGAITPTRPTGVNAYVSGTIDCAFGAANACVTQVKPWECIAVHTTTDLNYLFDYWDADSSNLCRCAPASDTCTLCYAQMGMFDAGSFIGNGGCVAYWAN